MHKKSTIPKAIKKAKKAVKSGDFEAAQKFYNVVLKYHPNHPVAYKGLRKLSKEWGSIHSPCASQSNPPSNLVNTLIKLYYSGQMRIGEKVCNDLLEKFPKSVIVMNIRGAIFQELGKFNDAITAFSQTIELNPDYAQAYNNRANAFKAIGMYREALTDYKKAIRLEPDYIEAYYNIGNTLVELGRPQEAIKEYNIAIQYKPDYAEVYNNKGNALVDLCRHQEALKNYNRALQLKPDFAEAYNNRGAVLSNLCMYKEALNDFSKAIKIKSAYAEAYNNRGAVLIDLRRFQEGLTDFNKAIKFKPDYVEAHNNRGAILSDLGRYTDAIEEYNKAIQFKPDYAEAYNNRGNALNELGKSQEALCDYNTAIQFKPDYAEAYNNRGSIFKLLGKPQQALADYKKAIQLKPDYAEAYRHLGTLKTYKPGDLNFEIMETLYENTKLRQTRMQLSFALANAYEDIGKYTVSFSYLVEGNRLRKKELGYSINDDKGLMAIIREIFTTRCPALGITIQRKSVIPIIFILGMPRSGTTLVEQILASHTQVYGAGELDAMGRLGRTILSRYFKDKTAQDKTWVLQDQINQLHNKYLETVISLNVPEKVITDKMPDNFLWIGFILSAFPNAKIIHVSRDPRATCWSIYKHYFTAPGNGYAYDMVDLAEFYKLYVDLMAFWRKCFPGKIYDLCYESLTENQKEETYSLLDYCGLKFEEPCLEFHKTERPVKTASAMQVREKMYRGSSEGWRKFERHIQPMITVLEERGVL